MSTHQIKAYNVLGISKIAVIGTINERYRWSDLKWYSQAFAKLLPASGQEGLKGLMPNLEIHMAEVAAINSTGIKKFRDRHNDIFTGRRSVELHEVSYDFLRDAMFLAPEVYDNCTVKSFQIPYQCPLCQSVQTVLNYDYELLDSSLFEAKITKTYPCLKKGCKGETTVVNRTGRYFWTTLKGIVEM